MDLYGLSCLPIAIAVNDSWSAKSDHRVLDRMVLLHIQAIVRLLLYTAV
jgi:hypothetical protein